MLITISDSTNMHMKELGLTEYPFTINQLKNCYRTLAMEHHPDKNPDGLEKMKKINSAYSWLKNLALADAETHIENAIDFQDDDIFNLYENCTECNGKGFKILAYPHRPLCPTCDKQTVLTKGIFGFSIPKHTSKGIKIKCTKCNCGKFTLKNGEKVNCKICNGTGLKRVVCPTCNNEGFLKEEFKQRNTCFKCEGKGKVLLKPFNPVIRKGAVL